MQKSSPYLLKGQTGPPFLVNSADWSALVCLVHWSALFGSAVIVDVYDER